MYLTISHCINCITGTAIESQDIIITTTIIIIIRRRRIIIIRITTTILLLLIIIIINISTFQGNQIHFIET